MITFVCLFGISIAFGAMRLIGFKSQSFQAASHAWFFGMLLWAIVRIIWARRARWALNVLHQISFSDYEEAALKPLLAPAFLSAWRRWYPVGLFAVLSILELCCAMFGTFGD